MENNLVKLNNEINRYIVQRNNAEMHLLKYKNEYRRQLVIDCVLNLIDIQKERGVLSKSDLETYINNMSLDIRDIYLK